jgi:hypothetical protein
VIEGFVAQPYPLFALVIKRGTWTHSTYRVIGWQQVSSGRPGELHPVLASSETTRIPSPDEHVRYSDSEDRADADGGVIAAALRGAVAEKRTTR